jgi:hypothetical protein
MKAAIYARVSMDDKGQDPLNELAALSTNRQKRAACPLPAAPSCLHQRVCLTPTTLR